MRKVGVLRTRHLACQNRFRSMRASLRGHPCQAARKRLAVGFANRVKLVEWLIPAM
jgi:hypothetical protein